MVTTCEIKWEWVHFPVENGGEKKKWESNSANKNYPFTLKVFDKEN